MNRSHGVVDCIDHTIASGVDSVVRAIDVDVEVKANVDVSTGVNYGDVFFKGI